MRPTLRLWPRTLVGRTVLVLLIGLTLSHLVGVGIYWRERRVALEAAGGEYLAERIASVVGAMEAAPPAQRAEFAHSLWGPGLRVGWGADSAVANDADDWLADRLRRAIGDYLRGLPHDRIRIAQEAGPGEGAWFERRPWGRRWRGVEPHGGEPVRRMMGDAMMGSGPDSAFPHIAHMMRAWQGGEVLAVSVQLSDRSWVNFAAPSLPTEPFWTTGYFFTLMSMTLIVIALSVWAVRRSAAPLALLARAAERLGVDVGAPPLREDGPDEVRQAAAAFNRMQDRLARLIKDRTQMLAAISHDLRTPITRLKLRAEFVDDEDQRRRMLADLDEMEAMISSTLAFARHDAGGEPRQALDLAVLLQDLCEAEADAGRDVRYQGPAHLACSGRPTALKRAFANLVDNAVKYGLRARVTLEGEGTRVLVRVDDDGPGIPEAERDNVFAPFYRIERSRSRETGGVGLGLSVVRSVVRDHGGEVMLANRPEGGLGATVELPAGAMPVA